MNNKLKIQIFGHSIAGSSHNGKEYTGFLTWSDLLIEEHDCFGFINNSFRNITMQSEERLLINLKKSLAVKTDLNIIFHGHPSFWYMPSAPRDWSKSNWTTDVNRLIRYETLIPNPFHGHENTTIIDENTLNRMLSEHHFYFVTPELQRARFNGALIQIDQICSTFKIPTIHCVLDKKHIPPHFKFTSGIVDYSIASFQRPSLDLEDGSQIKNNYLVSYNSSPNSISEEGNKIIYEKIKAYIEQLDEQGVFHAMPTS